MSGTFLDTGYLIALINKKDNLHKVALEATEKFHGPFLTTQLVLIELANSLCLPPQRPLAIKIIDRIQADPLTRVITLTPGRFGRALSLYKKRSDKSWGMIDCFSFTSMEEFWIK